MHKEVMITQRDATYEAIVVGGGPGGSTAATLIAKQGHKVLLLEKSPFPQYKVGESLLPATVHGICPMLGVAAEMREANFVIKRGGTFQWGPSPEPWTFSFSSSSRTAGPTSTAYQVERIKFDSILLNNAKRTGVTVCEGVAATEVILNQGRVCGIRYADENSVIQESYASYVVDASGHDSRIAKFVGDRIYSRFFQNIALFGYYRGGGRLPAPSEGNIFCVAFHYGWFWYIPLGPNLTSVGAVIDKSHAAQIGVDLDGAMSRLIRACPRISELLANASRVTDDPYAKLRVKTDYSYTTPKFWVPGLCLIGDAACFIDPVFSSGVHLATYSGLLAARSINTSLKKQIDESRCFNEFEARYRREYSLFHDFLIAFYDANQTRESPFWDARNAGKLSAVNHEAFATLVAGLSETKEELYSLSKENYHDRGSLAATLFPNRVTEIAKSEEIEKDRHRFYQQFLKEVTQVQMQSLFGDKRPSDRPLFTGGLMPSNDGMHWIS
jgi:halogenation protein CepH